MEPYETIELPHGFQLDIYPDNDASNPRKEFDHVGTLAIHPRCKYDLGDKGGWAALHDAIMGSDQYNEEWEECDFDNMADLETMLSQCEDIYWREVFLFDHGGISVSTGSFSCRWDSGRIGFIFVTKQGYRSEMGEKEDEPIAAANLLDNEVKELDQYCTGDVYGYQLIDPDGEEVDACWGFYGLEYCIEEAYGNVDHFTKEWLSTFKGSLP